MTDTSKNAGQNSTPTGNSVASKPIGSPASDLARRFLNPNPDYVKTLGQASSHAKA